MKVELFIGAHRAELAGELQILADKGANVSFALYTARMKDGSLRMYRTSDQIEMRPSVIYGLEISNFHVFPGVNLSGNAITLIQSRMRGAKR